MNSVRSNKFDKVAKMLKLENFNVWQILNFLKVLIAVKCRQIKFKIFIEFTRFEIFNNYIR